MSRARQLDGKMDVFFGVVAFVIFDEFRFLDELIQDCFVVLCPSTDWQFSNFHCSRVLDSIASHTFIRSTTFGPNDFSFKSLVPRDHALWFLAVEHTAQVVYDVDWTVARDACTETRSDSHGPVDKDHREKRNVMLRLDRHTVLVLILKHAFVIGRENRERHRI